MKLAIATTLFTSAAAFAPASKVATNSALKAFEGELGDQPPIGFWDPLGLVEDGDEKKFDRLRYVELKHGRIAMLAFTGRTVTQAGIRLPGSIDLEGTYVHCVLRVTQSSFLF